MLAITIRFDQNTFYNVDIYRIAHMKRNSIPILDQDIAKMSNAYESDKPPLTWTSCRPGRIWVKISSVTRWHPLALFDKVKVFCQPILYWFLKLWSGESNADGIDNLKFERLVFLMEVLTSCGVLSNSEIPTSLGRHVLVDAFWWI